MHHVASLPGKMVSFLYAAFGIKVSDRNAFDKAALTLGARESNLLKRRL